MATGEGTGDGRGSEEHIISLGGPSSLTKIPAKAIQENTIDSVLESRPNPKKNQPPKILPNLNDLQDRTLSKDKGHVPDSNYGHDDIAKSGQSSISMPPGAVRDGPGIFPSSNEEDIIPIGESSSSRKSLTEAIQGTGVQTAGSDPAPSSLGDIAVIAVAVGHGEVASIVVLDSPAPTQPNVVTMVTLPNVGPSEPIVATPGVAPAQSNVVAPPVVAPAQSNVVAPPVGGSVQPNFGPVVAPLGGVPAQQNVAPVVAPNVGPVAAPNVAPNVVPNIAPAQPDVALIVARPAPAQPNAAPPAQPNAAPNVAPAQPNVALIVALPGPAQPNAAPPAQLNAAPIVAPPNLAGAFDINGGLERSRLRPLRTCESESEGNLLPKL